MCSSKKKIKRLWYENFVHFPNKLLFLIIVTAGQHRGMKAQFIPQHETIKGLYSFILPHWVGWGNCWSFSQLPPLPSLACFPFFTGVCKSCDLHRIFLWEHFKENFLYANLHLWVYFPSKPTLWVCNSSSQWKQMLKCNFWRWAGSPVGWLRLKNPC